MKTIAVIRVPEEVARSEDAIKIAHTYMITRRCSFAVELFRMTDGDGFTVVPRRDLTDAEVDDIWTQLNHALKDPLGSILVIGNHLNLYRVEASSFRSDIKPKDTP